jgi:hypothetical protein
VKDFSQSMAAAKTDEQRLNLIKVFPIPNTKEDILEYMILASSNIGYGSSASDKAASNMEEKYESAWMTKFIQGYQKAKLVFDGDEDFKKVQKIYFETMDRMDNVEKERNIKFLCTMAVKNAAVICGMVALLAATCMNLAGANSAMVELGAIVILIVSASRLKKRNAEVFEFMCTAASGLFAIILAPLLDNGSLFQLGGGVILIISAINFVRR